MPGLRRKKIESVPEVQHFATKVSPALGISSLFGGSESRQYYVGAPAIADTAKNICVNCHI